MKRCPSGKRRFHDHEEAVEALRVIKRKPRRDRMPVRVYDCNLCAGWHFTAQPERGVEPG